MSAVRLHDRMIVRLRLERQKNRSEAHAFNLWASGDRAGSLLLLRLLLLLLRGIFEQAAE